MIYILKFARENNIQVIGFDSNINVINEDQSKEDEQIIIEKQSKIIKMHNWKEFNREKLSKKLNKISKSLIDEEKWDLREEEMKKNIIKSMPKIGSVILITGSGHIPYFKKNFPQAEFPYSS